MAKSRTGSRKDKAGRVLYKGESQRKDGSYTYYYTDPFGKRKFIYAQDLKKLREKEDILKRDQLDGLDVYVAQKATLNFVFDRYMSIRYDLRASTKTNYNYMYNHFVREGFGERLIAEIKYSDVKYFYLHLINDLGLQVNTVDTIHTILHPTFQLAVRDDVIRSNPSDAAMSEIKKKAGKNKGVRHALTIEQQRAFLNYIANEPIFEHWLSIFVVLLGTGCRIGEAIGLRWQDIDYNKKIIDINHSIVYYPEEGAKTKKSVLKVSEPKTAAGYREIPMIDEVIDVLKKEYEYQEEYGFNCSVIDGMSGFIFRNRYGNVHNPQTLNKAIKRIVNNHNAQEVIQAKKEKREPIIIPSFSCHCLRHTFCTRLCASETNLKVIQYIMGHANIETTMDIYAEVTKSKNIEAMTKLSQDTKLF